MQTTKFRGPVLRWNSYGSPAVLCEGELRVTGDGAEFAALGALPTGPVWCDISPDADTMAFFLEPHDPPDDHGFVQDGERLLVLHLPRALGSWQEMKVRLGTQGGVIDMTGAFKAFDQLRLGSAWGLPDRHLMAMGEAVRCEVTKAVTGTRFRLEAVVNPRRGGPEPLDEDIRVELDVIVPPPYGHHNPADEYHPQSVTPFDIDWRRQRFHAVMPGRVRWGQEAPRTGPLVAFAQYREAAGLPYQLQVRPATNPRTSALGGYTASTATDGPELVLPINWTTIGALLSQNPTARFSMAGDGCGHLDGQSGRSVYECGGHRRQEIERVEIALDWDGEWLRLRADGTLSTARYDLGPDFSVELDIHAHWLAAHGRIPRAKVERDAGR